MRGREGGRAGRSPRRAGRGRNREGTRGCGGGGRSAVGRPSPSLRSRKRSRPLRPVPSMDGKASGKPGGRIGRGRKGGAARGGVSFGRRGRKTRRAERGRDGARVGVSAGGAGAVRACVRGATQGEERRRPAGIGGAAMECPHLGGSVCLAPDSAKFPQGSPSSWCCSGECGSRAHRPPSPLPGAPRAPSAGQRRRCHKGRRGRPRGSQDPPAPPGRPGGAAPLWRAPFPTTTALSGGPL